MNNETRSVDQGRARVVVYEPVPVLAEVLSLFLGTQPDIEARGVSTRVSGP